MIHFASVLNVIGLGAIIFGLLNFLLISASMLVYFERKIAGWIQERRGPNRVGPVGILQPFADVVKLILKEDIVPSQSNRFLHALAPTVMVVIAMTVISVVPFGRTADGLGPLVVADIGAGILFVLALTSVTVYGIALAGWSSNSKYALLGGLRSAAQMISYELAMGAAVISVILWAGSLRVYDIIETQNHETLGIFAWNFIRNPIGFVIFVVAAFAETNRAPFDLPEAEQELVAGYHTEYSGMKFGMFFLAEYVNFFIASFIIVVLFFGGYLLPWEGAYAHIFYDNDLGWLLTILQIAMLLIKTCFWAFVFIWVRWTLPRLKYNQLMVVGWKYLLPIALANIILIAIIVALIRS